MNLSNAQKTLLTILVAICIISFTVAAWGIAKWGFARSSKSDMPGSITVSDSAEVKIQPDTAYISFQVVNKDKSVQKAAKENTVKTTAVISAITSAGIPKSDIQTENYSLEPEMDYDKDPAPIVGYTASNSVRVRTKDIAKIGDLIDSAITAGANSVGGIKFDVEDKKALRRKALELAAKKAKGKAESIANALDVKLGPATSAQETVDYYAPMTRNYLAKVASPAAATPIAPGEASVSAEVKVVFSIR